MRPLAQVIADLRAQDDLFADLFSRAWGLLDDPARRVLLALPLFPASADGAALAAIADMTGPAFDRAIERLAGLALLDILRSDLDRAALRAAPAGARLCGGTAGRTAKPRRGDA